MSTPPTPQRAPNPFMLVVVAIVLVVLGWLTRQNNSGSSFMDTAPVETTLLSAADGRQVIQFNPDAALQKRIFADGFVPNSSEFQTGANGATYTGQRAENLASGVVRVYYVANGDWGNVRFVERGSAANDALAAALLAQAEQGQVIQFNPDAALQKRIFADGFVPNSPEFQVDANGTAYTAQRAENLGNGQVRVYYVASGNTGAIGVASRSGSPASSAAPGTGLATTQLGVPAGLSMDAHEMRLAPGFSISVLATGLRSPRFMTFDDAGNLLIADMSGSVYRYPAANGAIAPSAQPPQPLLTGLNTPSSLALFKTDGGQYLYVGETQQISRYPYSSAGAVGAREVVAALPAGGGHVTRTVAFGPDSKMYVSVGSSCNICDEPDERRAAILQYNPDGSGSTRFASGLRNAVGLAFQPGTGALWATVNERDNQGNDIPPDLVTIVGQGQNFGWPHCQPPNAAPQEPGADCANITPPTVPIQAHSAPLGLTFYTGSQFPASYSGSLFVAVHGSWNRQPPAEPKLLHIVFQDGKPVRVDDFVAGWQLPSGQRWGRPVGVVVAPDGSLIVSDDQAGVLYQVRYTG
ncbi:MAG: PQQ-dependent sugar dehydrogenase [Anaerolineae bacterium]